MSESATTAAEEIGSEAPAALVQAVVDLGAQRTIKTSQPIYNAQGVKLLEGGVTIDQSLYDRLVAPAMTRDPGDPPAVTPDEGEAS